MSIHGLVRCTYSSSLSAIQTLRVFQRTGHNRVLGMPKIMVFKGVFVNPWGL